MAFILTQNPSYTVPVKVYTPNDKGGFDASEFKVKFKRANMQELESKSDIAEQIRKLELINQTEGGELSSDDSNVLEALREKFKSIKPGLRDLPQDVAMKRVILGFSELVDEDGKEVDFNENNLSALLMIPQALTAISTKFWLSIFKADVKN